VADQQRVGMIGLGIMGSAMSGNMIEAGIAVYGYDPVPAARAALKQAGGRPCASNAALVKAVDVVVTSLPSSAALFAVVDDIVAAKPRKGLVLAETSTLPIDDKEAARVRLAKVGAIMLDCTLSGTGAQARVKDLLVYGSGPEAAWRKVVPAFNGCSKAVHYLGAFGNGSKMKFVANLLVAIHNVAAGEAFALAIKAGLDPAQVLKVIGDGAGGSRMFQIRGPMMVENDYADATMKVEVWQKDMKIIGEFATKLGVATPLFHASAPIYTAAMSAGFEKEDTGSVCAVLESMSGIHRPRPRRAKARK
jgi:3-hydroxyisobutyrate dehydrogenase-like beta-hydroxyacid dehydrogenase